MLAARELSNARGVRGLVSDVVVVEGLEPLADMVRIHSGQCPVRRVGILPKRHCCRV